MNEVWCSHIPTRESDQGMDTKSKQATYPAHVLIFGSSYQELLVNVIPEKKVTIQPYPHESSVSHSYS